LSGSLSVVPKPALDFGRIAVRAVSKMLAWCVLAGPGAVLAGETAARHWSLQPRSQPPVPQVRTAEGQAWVRNAIDAFILDKLTQAGLTPAPAADRRTLLRRLTFDLTGLPPTPAEIAAFVNDPAAEAYEKVVERLLASPRYGEHWGRHWLDVVRYAETEGFEYDRYRAGAWRYRDYVIQAFNDDKPFDRFVLEQLAGDELDPGNPECLVAAGFHRLGPVRRNAGNKLVAMSRNEALTEMTDAIGSVFLGLTVGCARCHNHKFDNIAQQDYYHMQAFLAATHEHDVILASAAAQAQWNRRAEDVKAQIKDLQKRLSGKGAAQDRGLQQEIAALQRSLPEPLPTISSVHNLADKRTVIHVLKRGDPDRKGAAVGPRVPGVFLPDDAPELAAAVANPRTRLARWLTDPAQPLTARVWVNRVWQYHFGQGLVRTPNDFGVNGARPSHPELLDALANAFLAGGQRLKPLHRLIVLSSTYRQGSTARDVPRSQRLDPENRLLSHFPRRRLAAEEIRDAMLAAAGQLNLKAGGPSVFVPVEPDLLRLLYDATQWKVNPDEKEHDRRSVYLAAKRNLQLPFFQVFDQPDAQTSCARREASTHALQALELLNGRLSTRLARELADRLVRECGNDWAMEVERAFWLTAGRAPTARERALALQFLEEQPLREFAVALFNLNTFLYVD
jgi:Protein of unknown function (DUF1549)/Protein of unknown function (DUF1553)